MADVKDLLEAATPLPWRVYDGHWSGGRPGIEAQGFSVVVYGAPEDLGDEAGVQRPEDAELIVYAVNALPDYEAAVEALEALAELAGPETNEPEWSGNWRAAWQYARAALARLRESVPSA